ncbi:MAG: hypothetical protein HYT39_01025 [Candidatus Sungbacteria bacterium]|nr:hypothetical protein [Candidatus Sungbacteria bacterium]
MGAIIIDGILQAGINYNAVVLPRVLSFLSANSKLRTLTDFKRKIQEVGIDAVINFRNEAKIQRIKDIVNLLELEGVDTVNDFKKWLGKDANINKLKSIKGIGDKTSDYFQILVGISAVAVDTNIRDFLRVAGIKVKDDEYSRPKQIVENAAKEMNIGLSVLDYSIWSHVSSGKLKKFKVC